MQPATASVQIRRPRAAVQALLADVSRRAEFLDHFLADWTPIPEDARGAGAGVRLRATGGGRHDALEMVMTEIAPERIVEEARGGPGGRRRWRMAYELTELSGSATQVEFTIELIAGSLLDRASWPLMRTHLQRQYGQGMLRLKGLLEGEPGPRRAL
jgi:hypothetical protein